jgi:hypothetical protein
VHSDPLLNHVTVIHITKTGILCNIVSVFQVVTLKYGSFPKTSIVFLLLSSQMHDQPFKASATYYYYWYKKEIPHGLYQLLSRAVHGGLLLDKITMR